jgi:hypothetical protein
MTAPVLVQHPAFENVVEEVPAESVDQWTAAGWTRVTRADELKLREQLEQFDTPPAPTE